MGELVFSVFEHGSGSIARMRELLSEFEEQEKIRVRLETIPWDVSWSRLVEVALYHNGPDVSEIGNTWVMDFFHMNALDPFTRDEINLITDGARFFEPAWDSCVTPSDGMMRSVWAIPWSGDVRVVYYRRDLLAKAGVDESTAFQDAAAFTNTLKRLRESGVPTPLAMQTRFSHISVHNLAAWIWGAGGDFISADSRKILFHQDASLEGIKSYFRLGRYLGAQSLLDDTQADQMFWSGEAAVLMSGYWVIRESRMLPNVWQNLGVTRLPGIPFVGGQNLAIWKHSRQRNSAVRLLRFLSSQAVEQGVYPNFGLPIRENGWSSPPFNSPQYDIFRALLDSGRSFPNGRLWGLVEKRLTEVLPNLWSEVLQAPEKSDEIVETQIRNLANRLEMAIGG